MSETEPHHFDSIIDARFHALQISFEHRLRDSERLLVGHVDGNDRRYQERHEASEKALATAFFGAKEAVTAALAAAEKAVQAASLAAEKSVVAALAAAEKAIEKAEMAQNLHNISQNEWRATVNDLTKTTSEQLRHEFSALVKALGDKIEPSIKAIEDKFNQIATRMEKMEALSLGQDRQRGAEVTSRSQQMLLVGTVVGVLTLGLSWFAFHNSNGQATPQVVYIPNPAPPTTLPNKP
jgi:hypothetical protein